MTYSKCAGGVDTVTQQVPVAEFKRRLSEFLGRVSFKGDTIVITRRGRPVAKLSPVGHEPLHLGQVAGTLDDDDPFFAILDEVVRRRKEHTPRVWPAD
jgi:prevent-host-death family protein